MPILPVSRQEMTHFGVYYMYEDKFHLFEAQL